MKLHFTLKGPVEEYALAWLSICNNAREYPKIFLKYYNDSGCGVTIITPKTRAKNVKDWVLGLSSYKYEDGELKPTLEIKLFDEEEITTITPMMYYGNVDVEDWDELDSAEVLSAEDY